MSQATVTAVAGPAKAVTALVIPNMTGFAFDITRKILTVWTGAGVKEYGAQDFDINAITTVTCVIASGNYTLTVS